MPERASLEFKSELRGYPPRNKMVAAVAPCDETTGTGGRGPFGGSLSPEGGLVLVGGLSSIFLVIFNFRDHVFLELG